jgi:uncharacterized protein YjgD (DUF1641 family)
MPELPSEVIQMLVSSMTNNGAGQISEIEVERFLNAITRYSANTPTAQKIK